jgi:serine/threonine-protein kinase
VGRRSGTTVGGKYVLEGLIAEGGMGEVWRARHQQLGQRVALKMMRHADSGAWMERFLRETRAAGSLESEHVTRVFDAGTLEDGTPFMVMEVLEGEPLDRIARERAPLSIDEAVGYVVQACAGVAAAHARGIVHRDLKPSNLFVTRRTDGSKLVKVLDFGIAKSLEGAAAGAEPVTLTETGAAIGTPGYMAPEQLRAPRQVDERADIWALGLILFRLLTGRSAFVASSPGEYYAAILTEAPEALPSGHPPELAAAVDRCLHKKPARRFRDVAELARALAPFAPPWAAGLVEPIERLLEDARGRCAEAISDGDDLRETTTVREVAVVDVSSETLPAPAGRAASAASTESGATAPPRRRSRLWPLAAGTAGAIAAVAAWSALREPPRLVATAGMRPLSAAPLVPAPAAPASERTASGSTAPSAPSSGAAAAVAPRPVPGRRDPRPAGAAERPHEPAPAPAAARPSTSAVTAPAPARLDDFVAGKEL